MISNYEWLDQMCNIGEKTWHNDKVKQIYDIENHEYYIDKKEGERVLIDTSKIIGIKHGSYGNKGEDITWFDLLKFLKRFRLIKKYQNSREEIIKHIHTIYKHDGGNLRVIDYNGSYFITSGIHRLTIAKFLELKEVEVYIEYTEFDDLKYEKDQLRKEFKEFLVNNNLLLDLDYNEKETWEINNTFFSISESIYSDFKKMYENLSISPISLFLDKIFKGTTTRFIDINNNDDLNKYKYIFRRLKSKNSKHKN